MKGLEDRLFFFFLHICKRRSGGGVAGNWLVKVYKQNEEPAVQEDKTNCEATQEEAWPVEHGNRKGRWDGASKERQGKNKT